MNLFRHGKKKSTLNSSGAFSGGGIFQGTGTTRQRQEKFLSLIDQQAQEAQSARRQVQPAPQTDEVA